MTAENGSYDQKKKEIVLWKKVNLIVGNTNVITKKLIFYEDKGVIYLMDRIEIKDLNKNFNITAKKGKIDLQKKILILKGSVHASFNY